MIVAVVNAIYAIAWRSLWNWVFEPMTSRYRYCVRNCEDQSSFHFISTVHIWFISYIHYSLSILSPEHHWPAPNVSGFIALLIKAWRRCRAVTGSSTVEVLFFLLFFFSGFLTQLYEFHPQMQKSIVLQCSDILYFICTNLKKSKIDSENYLVS